MKNIYVGNLPYSTNEDAVRALFEEYGEVSAVHLISDRRTGRLKGFGFVEMNDDEAAEKAMESLNGSEMDQRTLRVNEARPREDNRGGGGGPRY